MRCIIEVQKYGIRDPKRENGTPSQRQLCEMEHLSTAACQ